MSLGLLAPVVAIAGTTAAHSESGDTRTPIQHTIIVYGENISFDHYFGTYGKGSNGIPADAQLSHTNTAVTPNTVSGPYIPTKLDGQTQSITCDVDHGYKDMLLMMNHGAMDQFLQFGNDKTTLGSGTVANKATCASFEANPAGPALANAYYEGKANDPASPLKTLWKLADNYVLADNFFQAISGPSTPGAEWLAAATSNTTGDPNPVGDVCNDYPAGIAPQAIPNLGQTASQKGVSWAWFQGGLAGCVNQIDPVTHLTNPNLTGYSAHHNPFQYFSSTADLTHKYALDPKLDSSDPSKHQRDLSVFDAALTGAKIGGEKVELPSISWVKADFSQDSHPGYSGPAAEDAFIKDLVAKVKSSKYWESTAIIFAYDETGGWWDHVAPPVKTGLRAPYNADGTPNTANGCDYPPATGTCAVGGDGPRMPVLIVSPFAKKGLILHEQLDTTSLVRWVEWNHQLPALGLKDNRDVTSPNLTHAFNFDDA